MIKEYIFFLCAPEQKEVRTFSLGKWKEGGYSIRSLPVVQFTMLNIVYKLQNNLNSMNCFILNEQTWQNTLRSRLFQNVSIKSIDKKNITIM